MSDIHLDDHTDDEPIPVATCIPLPPGEKRNPDAVEDEDE